MAAVKFSFALCMAMLLAIKFSEGGTTHEAPAPAVDCSSLILNMADCLSFVSNDSTTEKPEGTCCSGLKTVLKADADCLCQAFRSSAQLGVILNVTKALSLPAACQVSAPAAAKCGLLITPVASPAISPRSSQPLTAAATPGTVAGANDVALSPAPAPASSSTSAMSGSLGSVLAGLGFAFFCCLLSN